MDQASDATGASRHPKGAAANPYAFNLLDAIAIAVTARHLPGREIRRCRDHTNLMALRGQPRLIHRCTYRCLRAGSNWGRKEESSEAVAKLVNPRKQRVHRSYYLESKWARQAKPSNTERFLMPWLADWNADTNSKQRARPRGNSAAMNTLIPLCKHASNNIIK